MSAKNIKIPAKHYVGMVKRQTEKIPLGFITPWGEDASAKKRIATVDTWSKQGYNGKALPSMTIDNVPMSGFRMTTDIRSSSYGGADKWRIEDPRGFELEITSHNLAQLLTVGMIDRGEIVDTCVWARDGQQNVLLSTSTEEYKAAVENTNVANMTADWKQVKHGNTVLLQNNVSGVWLGRMHGIYINGYSSREADNDRISITDKSMHVIYIDTPDKQFKHRILLINTPKLAAITNADTISEAEAEIAANTYLNDDTCYTEQGGYKDYIALTIGAPKIGNTATLSLEPISIGDVDELEKLTYYRGKKGIYLSDKQYLYKLSSQKNYNSNKCEFTASAFSLDSFKEHQLVPVGSMVSSGSYWGRSNSHWKQTSYQYSFKADDAFNTLVVTIQTKSGNTVKGFAS